MKIGGYISMATNNLTDIIDFNHNYTCLFLIYNTILAFCVFLQFDKNRL